MKVDRIKSIKKECPNCKRVFDALLKEIKRGGGKFCSRGCAGAYIGAHRPKPDPNVHCALCGKGFYKNASKQTLSKSRFYFCCRAHKDAAQRIGGIKEIMPPHYGTGTGESTYRERILAIKPYQCERCGYNAHKAAIVVHHKDRDRSNNDLDNLEVLCANCHAIEHWGD